MAMQGWSQIPGGTVGSPGAFSDLMKQPFRSDKLEREFRDWLQRNPQGSPSRLTEGRYQTGKGVKRPKVRGPGMSGEQRGRVRGAAQWADEFVTRGTRTKKFRLPKPVKAAGNFLPGPWRLGFKALELGLEIAQWEPPGPTEIVWNPEGSGFGLFWQCGDENAPFDEIRYDSSNYCGPLTDPGGTMGVGHSIQPHWSGYYTRHDWGFGTYTNQNGEPYPYAAIAGWASGAWGGWYEATSPSHQAEMGWPARWQGWNENGIIWTDDESPLDEWITLPEEILHPGRWTFLWPGGHPPTPIRVPMEPGPEKPPRLDPPPEKPKPPGPKVKEKKLALTITGTLLGSIFSATTEGLDVLNCLHGSIGEWKTRRKPSKDKYKSGPDGKPYKIAGKPAGSQYFKRPDDYPRPTFRDGKWRRPSPQDFAAWAYRNINALDAGTFMECLVENQIEDFIIGKAGQLTKNANQLRGQLAGIEFGPAL